MSTFISPFVPRQTATAVQEPPQSEGLPVSSTNSATVNYVTWHGPTRSKIQVTAEAASKALQHLIALRFKLVGFSGTDLEALETLNHAVADFILQIAGLAVDYANLANRTTPNVRDMLAACEGSGMTIESLRGAAKKSRKRDHSSVRHTVSIVAPPQPPKPPVLLPSDSESGDEGPQSKQSRKSTKNANHPPSLQSLPPHFPVLPPKHTYLRTQVPPPTATSLSSLQQKIDNAAIIQDSLRNLIQTTEAPPAPRGQTDDEGTPPAQILPVPAGLGGLVNWEAAGGNRRITKRWKV